jgi:hypothetical protein
MCRGDPIEILSTFKEQDLAFREREPVMNASEPPASTRLLVRGRSWAGSLGTVCVSDVCEKSRKLYLHLQSALDRRIVDPIGESECRHAFHVFRPALPQLDQGLRGSRRPQLLAAIEVSQQQGFVTRSLPDDSYTSSLRNGCDLRIAKRCLAQSITIDQHCPMYVWRLTLALALGNSLASKLNECQGISATGLEQDHVKVHIAAAILKQATDECSVAALAFSFATQKDATTLRYE